MTHKEIIKRLIDRDITQTDIARREGVSVNAIGQVIRGRTVSARLRRAIAGAIGVPVEKIWPPKDSPKEAA
jgi:transcriptional regulator with XRE-family HTH domain